MNQQPPDVSSALIVTALSFVLAVKGVHILRPLPRLIKAKCESVRAQMYNHVFLRFRSEISLFLGCILFRRPFECECCCLELGSQDLDEEYSSLCLCSSERPKCCRMCSSTFLSNQITDNQATKLVCMASRRCVLDDRFVRKRLSSRVVALLDRNQVLQAAAASRTKEILWSCPSPDCNYVGFVSNNTRRNPSLRNYLLAHIVSADRLTDQRMVRCPECAIASCQFCSRVWSRGMADHTGMTCEAYAAQYTTGRDDTAFERWKHVHQQQVQLCPQCNSTIEKNSGCNHMTCRCGHEFCWVCRDPWSCNHSYFCRNRRRPDDPVLQQRAFDVLAGWFR